jgi:predicted metal-dependent hydrolase
MQGLFERGVEEFNGQSFFEAHDTWEELWMQTTGPHRLFYQGLIQVAVGFYHLSNGNYKGACSQFGKAIAKLEHYLPAYQGIETSRLIGRVREWLQDAERLRDGAAVEVDESTFPQIEFCVIE